MKGIILAGGSGTRLYPLTVSVSKQLLPIYDKPMVYYLLSTLMLAGIREILIISTPESIEQYQELLCNGSQFGIELSYAVQFEPRGIAEAFIVGESFVGNDDVCLILGDNIFYGQGFTPLLKKAVEAVNRSNGAVVFAQKVSNPEQFGVINFTEDYFALGIEEKPLTPKSNYAVTGLYFYDNSVLDKAKLVRPSSRNELEISTINQMYLAEKNLRVEILGRGFAWLDTGTIESLHEASNFIATVQKQQGFLVACLEEIAFEQGWITLDHLKESTKNLKNVKYQNYLTNLANRDE